MRGDDPDGTPASWTMNRAVSRGWDVRPILQRDGLPTRRTDRLSPYVSGAS
jgi:hypothetical protein